MQTTIRFLCYHCRRVHTVDSTAAGRRGRCLCGTLMKVPDASAAVEPWRPDSMPVALPAEELPAYPSGNGHASRTASETGIPIGAPEILPDGTIGRREPQGLPGTPTRVSTRSPQAEPGPVEGRPGPASRSRPRAWGRATGALEVVLSLPVLAWAFLQTFHAEVRTWREFREGWSLPAPDYLSLPPAFWSTVLFALFVTLFVDGWRRILWSDPPSSRTRRD